WAAAHVAESPQERVPPRGFIGPSAGLRSAPSTGGPACFPPHPGRPGGAIPADFRDTVIMASAISDAQYQDQVLPHVSRTFALTIPQLPAALRIPVTNAYLLCRIADPSEDEPALSPTETLAFMQRFMGALAGRGDPQALG